MTKIIRLFQLAAVLGVTGTPPARADFQMGAPMTQPTPETPNDAPVISAVPKFKNAKGYGNGVPLDFAARQIVPTSVRLRFASGVDRDALVTWRGDAPWNHILTEAVRPLGLRVLTGVSVVTISR